MACCNRTRAQVRIRWTILAFSIITFIFATLSIAHCSFLLVGDASDSRKELEAYGIFSWAYESDDKILGCVRYSDSFKDDFGAPEKSARAFGTLAALFTGFAMLLVVLLQLLVEFGSYKKHAWLAVRILFPSALVAQTLTFSVVASETCSDANESSNLVCTIGPAGIIASWNTTLLLAVSILSCLVAAPPRPALILKVRDADCEGSSKHVANMSDDVEAGTDAKNGTRRVQYYHDDEDDNDDASIDSSTLAPSNPYIGGSETVEVHVTKDPSGRKKTTKIVTRPDGTKSITTVVGGA